MKSAKILYLIFVSAVISDVQFKIKNLEDGCNIELLKDKKTGRNRGEDSFKTTPLSLSVADGVSSCPFSSKYLSSLLVAETTQVCLQNKQGDIEVESTDDFRKRLLGVINSKIHDFAKSVGTVWSQKKEKIKNFSTIIPLDMLITSTTFITAFIDNSNKETSKIKILQKGDSSLAIFRPTKSSKGDGWFYKLSFVTSDQQNVFNQPFQFTSEPSLSDNPKYDAVFEKEIQVGDIVIVGSDGLFDNVHVSLLTLYVNMLAKMYVLSKETELVDEALFYRFVDDLYTLFNQKKDSLIRLIEAERSKNMNQSINQEAINKLKNQVQKSHDQIQNGVLNFYNHDQNYLKKLRIVPDPVSKFNVQNLLEKKNDDLQQTKDFFGRRQTEAALKKALGFVSSNEVKNNPIQAQQINQELNKSKINLFPVEKSKYTLPNINSQPKTDLSKPSLVNSNLIPEEFKTIQKKINTGIFKNQLTQLELLKYQRDTDSFQNNLGKKFNQGSTNRQINPSNLPFDLKYQFNPNEMQEIERNRDIPKQKIDFYGKGTLSNKKLNSLNQETRSSGNLIYNQELKKNIESGKTKQDQFGSIKFPIKITPMFTKAKLPNEKPSENPTIRQLFLKPKLATIKLPHAFNLSKKNRNLVKGDKKYSDSVSGGPTNNGLQSIISPSFQQKTNDKNVDPLEISFGDNGRLSEDAEQILKQQNMDFSFGKNQFSKKNVNKDEQINQANIEDNKTLEHQVKQFRIIKNRPPTDKDKKVDPEDNQFNNLIEKQDLRKSSIKTKQQSSIQGTSKQDTKMSPNILFEQIFGDFLTLDLISIIGLKQILKRKQKNSMSAKETDQELDSTVLDFVDSHFYFSVQELNIFYKKFDATQFSNVIGKTAKRITEPMGGRPLFYPSVFYLKSLKETDVNYPCTAKDDDISLVAALVINKNENDPFYFEDQSELLEFMENELMVELSGELNTFMDYQINQIRIEDEQENNNRQQRAILSSTIKRKSIKDFKMIV